MTSQRTFELSQQGLPVTITNQPGVCTLTYQRLKR